MDNKLRDADRALDDAWKRAERGAALSAKTSESVRKVALLVARSKALVLEAKILLARLNDQENDEQLFATATANPGTGSPASVRGVQDISPETRNPARSASERK